MRAWSYCQTVPADITLLCQLPSQKCNRARLCQWSGCGGRAETNTTQHWPQHYKDKCCGTDSNRCWWWGFGGHWKSGTGQWEGSPRENQEEGKDGGMLCCQILLSSPETRRLPEASLILYPLNWGHRSKETQRLQSSTKSKGTVAPQATVEFILALLFFMVASGHGTGLLKTF